MTPQPPPQRTADEAIAELKDLYVRQAREIESLGREVPAMPVPADAPGARDSVRKTQEWMRKSRSRTFGVPDLPWKRDKNN